jgi:CubicO group peptidase (beta-lactamase class C family)
MAGSPEEVGVDKGKLRELCERAEREVREGLLPSAQLAVARDGKLAFTHALGDVTHQGRPAPATDETLYCVFSSTKAITSAAAWLLIQEGKLGLEERVADVIPEFGTNGKDRVLVEQLFTHTAGFPMAPFAQSEWPSRDRRLERFAEWRLNYEPGTQFIYHPTSSMWVIAELCDRRSGVDFQKFVRERIALPLGLPDLWMGLPPAEQHRAADLVHVGEALTPEQMREMGYPEPPETEVTEDALQGFNQPHVRAAGVPGGGAFTNASSMALFYQALLTGLAPDGRVIWKAETLEMARRVRSGELRDLMFGKLANRGLGVIISGDRERNYRGFGHTNSAEAFGHGGAGGQVAWADPATGLSFAYLTNGMDRNPVRLARRGVGLSSRAAVCVPS